MSFAHSTIKRITSMKKYLAVISLLFCASYAHAGKDSPAYTYEVGVSSVVTNIVSVSSSSATQMDSPQLVGRVSVEIQNINGSVNLWCSPSSGVTANNGRKITPGSTWVINFSDVAVFGSAIKFYCINDSTTASSNAAVTQGY